MTHNGDGEAVISEAPLPIPTPAVLDNITFDLGDEYGDLISRLTGGPVIGFFDIKAVSAQPPSVSSRALYQASRELGRAHLSEPRLLHDVDKGNNSAAWQEPELFTVTVRAAFRSLG